MPISGNEVIMEFNKKISAVRSRGLNLIPVFQNIGQIKSRYPNDVWQEIIGNCDLRLCLRCCRYTNSTIF